MRSLLPEPPPRGPPRDRDDRSPRRHYAGSEAGQTRDEVARDPLSQYLKSYQRVPEARAGIDAYLGFYNEERPHQALGYRTPREVFEMGRADAVAMATENPERGCIFGQQPVSYPQTATTKNTAGGEQPVSYPQTATTKNTAGGDLILAPSLSY